MNNSCVAHQFSLHIKHKREHGGGKARQAAAYSFRDNKSLSMFFFYFGLIQNEVINYYKRVCINKTNLQDPKRTS